MHSHLGRRRCLEYKEKIEKADKTRVDKSRRGAENFELTDEFRDGAERPSVTR